MGAHAVFWTTVTVSFVFGFVFGYAFRFGTEIRNAINEIRKKAQHHDTSKSSQL